MPIVVRGSSGGRLEGCLNATTTANMSYIRFNHAQPDSQGTDDNESNQRQDVAENIPLMTAAKFERLTGAAPASKSNTLLRLGI